MPREELSAQIPPPPSSSIGLGRKPWFNVKGGIALQILKHCYQLSDAKLIEHINTCYESYIEFPTDVKLVWKGCEELYGHLQKIRKTKKLRPSRVNYAVRKKEYLTYQKSRKKTNKGEKKPRKKMVKFLALNCR